MQNGSTGTGSMRLRIRGWIAWAFVAALLLPARHQSEMTLGASAPRPAAPVVNSLPKATKATTQQQFLTETLESYRSIVSSAYASVGKKNPAWNAAATAYLQKMCVYLTYYTDDPGDFIFSPADLPASAAMVREGEQLLAVGCTDPMVLYCHALVLLNSRQNDVALPLIHRAVEGFKTGTYAPQWTAGAAWRLLQFEDKNNAADRTVLEALIESSCIRMVTSKPVNQAHRRAMHHLIVQMYRGRGEAEEKLFVALRPRQDGDSWLVRMIGGDMEMQAGWKARGGGYANTVTEEGFKGFHQHLDQASSHFRRGLDPGAFLTRSRKPND